MRIIRTPAYQGHAVPQRAGYAKGPFNPDVLAEPVIIVTDGEPEPYNATAQNDMRGEPLYRCQLCEGIVPESGIDAHQCGGDDGS